MAWVAAAVVGSAVIGAVASNRAADKGVQALEKGQDILAQSREQARQDVLRLFPEAQQAQTRGFEESRDFLAGQVLPQQAGLFQQGNVAGQETLLAGLPQVQSAILGQPTDLSGLQARQFQLPQFDVSGFNQPIGTPPRTSFQPPQPDNQQRFPFRDIQPFKGFQGIQRGERP